MERVLEANRLYKKLPTHDRDDAMAMQYLIPGWKSTPRNLSGAVKRRKDKRRQNRFPLQFSPIYRTLNTRTNGHDR